MNQELLQQHIKSYLKYLRSDQGSAESSERADRCHWYQRYTQDRIEGMSEDEFFEFISNLYALRGWGNKKYFVDNLIQKNGFFKALKEELAMLVWGQNPIENRWDHFRSNVKGIGPAMMSEILAHIHPNECAIWNRRVYEGLSYLEVKSLPRHNYQLTGETYKQITALQSDIAKELTRAGMKDVDLIWVDYFIWKELKGNGPLKDVYDDPKPVTDPQETKFLHDEVRDKIAEIGTWLGLESNTEITVSRGSRVDAIWEATIGNMGRVIYVFEVQTKGSIDSLIVNLFKSLNNPAVQGVVAVSDAQQIEKIRAHAAGMAGLSAKLKCWDYQDVLIVHESLERVNESINSLELVPQSF
ncbi:MAG: hypothetical protein F4X93_04285 [Proteobacteria bacterium]|nr:hypothetical protein [Pseudomonadota bacterium]